MVGDVRTIAFFEAESVYDSHFVDGALELLMASTWDIDSLLDTIHSLCSLHCLLLLFLCCFSPKLILPVHGADSILSSPLLPLLLGLPLHFDVHSVILKARGAAVVRGLDDLSGWSADWNRDELGLGSWLLLLLDHYNFLDHLNWSWLLLSYISYRILEGKVKLCASIEHVRCSIVNTENIESSKQLLERNSPDSISVKSIEQAIKSIINQDLALSRKPLYPLNLWE